MPEKRPTATQLRLLRFVRDGRVRRMCFRSESLRYVSMTYRWVAGGDAFADGVVRACESRGWVEVVEGALKPGVPANVDPLRIAMGNLREPSTLRLTDAGRAVLGGPDAR